MDEKKANIIQLKKDNYGHKKMNNFIKNNNNIDNNEILSNLIKQNINIFKKRTKYELMYEAFYISNLFYEMHNTQSHLKDPYFYIISSDWLIKWKKYVNFDFYTNENGWKNFIKLNILPFRPKDIISQKENYLKYIKDDTKAKIYKYFDSIFLSDNSQFYPGYINNKKLLIDRGLKDTYINRNQLQSNYNYNLIDKCIFKENYIWVTEDIWKYFYCIYGGFEIRRHNLNLIYKNKVDIKDEIILEPKLKIINLIVFHYNKNYNYKIDPPKYFYISHTLTIFQMKEKLSDIFTYIKKLNLNNIHLWVLDEKMNDNNFYEYVWNNRKFNGGIDFPGISLDIFNQNLYLEELNEKIIKNNSILVLEIPFFYSYNNISFFFKEPQFNNYSDDLKLLCIKINNNNNNNSIIDFKKPYYDHLSLDIINNEFIINIKLFLIKKFFWNKYILDKIKQCPCYEMYMHLERIINNFKDKNILNIFNEEIKDFRKNMDLVFDKTFLAKNIDNLYLNEFENINNIEFDYEINHNNKKDRNDIILLNKKKIRENNEESYNEDEIDNISWYSCGFCKKNLDQKNFVVCSFCLRKKYCNNICRNNDIENHLKYCGN